MAEEQQDVSAIGAIRIAEVAGVSDAHTARVIFSELQSHSKLGGEISVGEDVMEKIGPGGAGIDEEVAIGLADLQAVFEDELVDMRVEIVAGDGDVGAVEITRFVSDGEYETVLVIAEGAVDLTA